MAELKTRQTDQRVTKFLNAIKDDQTREDCFTILEVMKKITKTESKLYLLFPRGFRI